MKKTIFAIATVAVMFAASCQKSDDVVSDSGKSVVTFVVQTPEITTRAFGDGTQATDLYYGIYNESGELISAISKVDDTDKETINITTKISLTLVIGNTYSMIFWADNADDACSVDFKAKKMTYAPAKANAEAYDAFWAYVEPFEVTGNLSKNVYLYRPFAQLNVGSDDIKAASAAGMTVAKTKVTVTTPTRMDLVTGAVDTETELVYDYSNLPAGETFPVKGYDYLSMNYLLVGANKATADVKFGYTDGATDYEQTYTFVPIQRNYRTNIYGSILTSSVGVNIIIDPIFNEPDYNVETGK